MMIILFYFHFSIKDDQEDIAESAVVGYPHDVKGEGKQYKGDNSNF